jgi:hypothetical protein
MYFDIKNYLKNTNNHTDKDAYTKDVMSCHSEILSFQQALIGRVNFKE